MAEIDYQYWANIDRWNQTEAALLLDGKDPDEHRGVKLRASDVTPPYEKAAKVWRTLERTDWSVYGRRPFEVKNHPMYIVDAAKTKGVTVPAGLLEEIRKRQDREQRLERGSSVDEKPNVSAETKERQTMLKLIIGLACGGYRMDPNASRNMHAKEMRIDLERVGLPLDDETIKKYLDEAKKLRRDILARRAEGD